MSFDNKVVFVTGAASGIGEAIAVHFAKLSAKLCLLDINVEKLEKVKKICDDFSKYKALKIVADVTKDADVKQAVKKAVDEFGRIDVVVNSAGITSVIGILDPEFLQSFDQVLGLNLRSYAVVTHFSAAALIKSKGCFINISSICAKLCDKFVTPYYTSKAAVVHFTKNVALELADKGVRANCILPGVVQTNLLTNSGLSQETIMKVSSKAKLAPLKHFLQLEEIAELAAFLASDKAKSITGAEFVIDSGCTLLGSLMNNDELI